MERSHDYRIGRDIVLEELEPLSDLLKCLPSKAQFGPKNLVGHFWEKTKEHGVKSLFSSLKERAHENFKSLKIEYTCLDVSFDAVVLGTNLGVIFLYDRTCRKLSRLPSEVTHEPAQCLKLLSAHSYVAVGFSSGLITIFTFVLASQGFGKLQTLHVSGAHNCPITCLEWSPDGELLYSGDVGNKVYVTVINFQKGLTQTALMLEESSPIVQLAYSWEALLISSEKRTILWDFRTEKLTQIGQKERKSPGKYGGCLYPPARPLPDEDTNNSPSVYTSRPGLRLWTADTGGKVSATLMYKGLTNENPPGITILSPPPPCLTKYPPDFQAQFGRLLIYHGQFLVTWDVSHLWVLDTSPCALVGFHGNLGDIVDVSTAGHEIYVLQRAGERLIMKLSLIPKLPNPLVDLATLVEHSYKDEDHSDEDKKQEEPTVSQTESIPAAEVSKITEVVTSEDSQSEVASVTEDPVKPAPNPFLRYQEIRHQDFGEIVFKKTKRSKKKNQKDAPPRFAVESDTEAKDRSTSVDSQDGVKSSRFPSTSGKEPKSANSSDSANTPLEVSSDISSDFDSTERNDDSSSEKTQSGEREDKRDTTRPQLTVVHVTESGEREKHEVDLNCVTTTDEVTELRVACSVNSQQRSMSPNSHASASDDTLTPEETSCANSLVSSMSSVMEGESDDTDELLSPDESYQADYLPNIYSNTPVNIFDATFSDVSVEKSTRSRSRATKSSMSAAGSALPIKGSSDVQTDSEGTPPVSLDSEGAEELSDTASWTWSLSRRTLSDVEVLHHSDASALEGSFSSQSSESSLSRSPVSNNLNLRLLADSWADYSPPGHGYVQFVAVSDTHIWCVTTHEFIFYCPTHFSVVTWTQIRGSAKMIAVNSAGDVIWCIDRKNYAFTRVGVSSNRLTGMKWVPVEKDMRFVTIEDTAVWGIKLNGDVFVRTEVTRDQPTGKGWRTIRLDTTFVQVSCMNGIVWFVDKSNHIHVFRGVSPSKPADKENWEQLQGVSAKWICLGIEGVAWIVDVKGALWFSNVTQESPMGSTWYQVSLGQYLMQDRSLLESLWSWVVRGDEVKLLTASPKAGVWLLGRSGSLQASHGHLLGSRWNPVTPHGMAKSVFWSYLSAGALKGDKGHLWTLQPNGELICFQPGGRPIIVEPPKRKVLKLVAASGQNLWAITHNFKVVQRVGISDSCPEGFDWMDLNLEQFGVSKVCHLSCGALSTWAVDDAGNVWLRIGKEDSQDPAVTQAWIPVDGRPLQGCRFAKVAVSPADRVVWAVDDRNNVYARRDVTPSFPIGTSWEVVPGTGVRDLAMSEHMIWATSPNGDIVCRYGVSESNCLGHYWKKLPGNFELISVSPDDELWAIDQNGRLFLRQTQHFYGTQSPFRPRTYSALFSGEDDWEFI